MDKIIKLLRRAPRKNCPKHKIPIYEICIVPRGSHSKDVIEKLGTYSLRSSVFSINIFRLCYWISRGVSLSGNCMRLLVNTRILRFQKRNDNLQ